MIPVDTGVYTQNPVHDGSYTQNSTHTVNGPNLMVSTLSGKTKVYIASDALEGSGITARKRQIER